MLLSAYDEAGKETAAPHQGTHDSSRLLYQQVTRQMARLSQSWLADGLIRPISLISLSLSLSLEHGGIYITAVH